MVGSDILKALAVASDTQRPVVHEVFRNAGLLWSCRHASCQQDNLRSATECDRCGRDRSGQLLSDRIPHSALPDAVEGLRTALREHLVAWPAPPDAVTFQLTFGPRWSHEWATLHHGSDTQELDDFEDTVVSEALTALGAPVYGDTLRLRLRD